MNMMNLQLPIAKQTWKKVTIHQVYHAFLKSEFKRCIETFGQQALDNKELVDSPDFDSESQNCKRSFLLCFRAPLLFQIPCSTVWYKVLKQGENTCPKLEILRKQKRKKRQKR